MRADEIMSDDVITIRATQTVADALEVFSERRVRHLPVLGDAGQLVGMLSDRDVRSLGVPQPLDGQSLDRLRERLRAAVSSAMQGDVATVAPETDLRELIDTMLDAGVGALPVIDADSDTLVGIVSYVDVLRAVALEEAA
jgi:acetoin utilization protein AcuB